MENFVELPDSSGFVLLLSTSKVKDRHLWTNSNCQLNSSRLYQKVCGIEGSQDSVRKCLQNKKCSDNLF